MAKQDYLPGDADDLDTFYDNWETNIAAVLTALSLPATHADAVKAKVTTTRGSFSAWKNKKNEAESFSNTFKADRKLAEDAIRPYNKNLKTTTGYTVAIGNDIGIEGDEETVDPSTAKPKIKGVWEGGEGIIKFNLHPAARSIRITCKRDSEPLFTYLGDDTSSPYNDARPLQEVNRSEKREYIGQYVNKDGDLIGQPSDKIFIVFPAITT